MGSVTPAGAAVRVDHQRARIVKGKFRHSLVLRRGINHIEIIATAHGYQRAITRLPLRFVPTERLPGPSSPPNPGDPAFFARVQSACGTMTTRIQRLPRVTSASTFVSDAMAEQRLIKAFDSRLRAARPPADLTPVYEQFVAIELQVKSATQRVIDTLKSGHTTDAAHAEERVAAFDSQGVLIASQLGLTRCLTEPVPSA